MIYPHTRHIIHIPRMEFPLRKFIIFPVNTDLLIRTPRQKLFHRIIKQPVLPRRPFKKMESMGRINHRACPRHMCRQTRHHPSHRRVTVHQRKIFPAHQLNHLTIHMQIPLIKRTSHKINLMADNPRSIQTAIIRPIGRRIKIRSIMNFISHAL